VSAPGDLVPTVRPSRSLIDLTASFLVRMACSGIKVAPASTLSFAPFSIAGSTWLKPDSPHRSVSPDKRLPISFEPSATCVMATSSPSAYRTFPPASATSSAPCIAGRCDHVDAKPLGGTQRPWCGKTQSGGGTGMHDNAAIGARLGDHGDSRAGASRRTAIESMAPLISFRPLLRPSSKVRSIPRRAAARATGRSPTASAQGWARTSRRCRTGCRISR
jgi:hypothetical protein